MLYPNTMEEQKIIMQAEEANKGYVKVQSLLQNPELPNGCEIVSLTAVLNYYGYAVSKTEMADTYLPKQDFEWKNDKKIGPNPYITYAGNPRSNTNGWYSFAPPLVKATENYMKTQENKMIAMDVSGSTIDELQNYIIEGKPVVVWVTLDLSTPRLNSNWYIKDSGEYQAYTNLHVVVLHGFNEETGVVYAMNPLVGHVQYEMDKFFTSYEEMGKHALMLVENKFETDPDQVKIIFKSLYNLNKSSFFGAEGN